VKFNSANLNSFEVVKRHHFTENFVFLRPSSRNGTWE